VLRRDVELRRTGLALGALLGTALAAASLVLLDAAGPWLWTASAPTIVEVLAAHRAPSLGLDAAAFLRLPGPVVLLFAALGLLRRQRHASNLGWLFIALAGAVPAALLVALPQSAAALRALPPGFAAVPAGCCWLLLVAMTVLGAAGLDDFLERPMRRAWALPVLLVALVLGTPALLLTSPVPMHEWPLVATFLALAVLLFGWRGIGMLRLKNVLAVVTVVALLIPAIQVLTVTGRPLPSALPATPAVELAAPPALAIADRLAAAPRWHYSGLAAVLLWACAAAAACRRRTSASAVPARARSAIAKKAPPRKRP
jgi:hypothetical protein